MFRVQQMDLQAGVGTHMDAPAHCIPGGASIADIPLEQLIVPVAMIDVSAKADANYEISSKDIEDYEKNYGTIVKNSLVVGFTGWSRFWNDAKAYRNEDAQGQRHFPAFSAEAAALLIKRDIAGIAIDTLSPDCSDLAYPVHKLILGAGKYIIENIADCSPLPPSGSYAIALPMRVESGTESPIRIISLIPRSK